MVVGGTCVSEDMDFVEVISFWEGITILDFLAVFAPSLRASHLLQRHSSVHVPQSISLQSNTDSVQLSHRSPILIPRAALQTRQGVASVNLTLVGPVAPPLHARNASSRRNDIRLLQLHSVGLRRAMLFCGRWWDMYRCSAVVIIMAGDVGWEEWETFLPYSPDGVGSATASVSPDPSSMLLPV